MENKSHPGRSNLMNKIEKCILEILEEVFKQESPIINLRNSRNWKNCDFENCITPKPDARTKISYLKNKERFARIIHAMRRVYQLLISDSHCSLRKLFYDDVDIYENQRQSNDILKVVCSILDCMPAELGIFPTSKGLIAGPLILHMEHVDKIDCSKTGGVRVPEKIASISRYESDAKFILMVEKETVFRKLLDEDIFNKLGPLVLITGRGFPDISTRKMLRMLSSELKIPVYGLTDCDPHGIEIMLVYRFGSLSQSQFGKLLAVPSLEWIGLLPKDLRNLQVPSINLNRDEMQKIEYISKRLYVQSNPELRSEIQIMMELSSKAEIESLYNFSPSYLTNIYLPNKVLGKVSSKINPIDN